MSEVKKLTTEEIEQIKELQAQYNKYVFELGSLEAQISEMANHKEFMDSEKANVLGDIKTLTTKEKELLASLQEKYGAGNIDLETGEISVL